MTESTRRTIRTLIQFLGGLPVTVLAVVLFNLDENTPAVLAIQGVVQALVTALQNALEDSGSIPAVLKNVKPTEVSIVSVDPVVAVSEEKEPVTDAEANDLAPVPANEFDSGDELDSGEIVDNGAPE